MFQVTSTPAACQLVLYIDWSPSRRKFVRPWATISLSSSVAVDTSGWPSAKRRAVSFITANASGRICSRTSSNFSFLVLPSLSTSFSTASRVCRSSIASASVLRAAICASISVKYSLILARNSCVLCLSSSLDNER
ncbi:hypothetical protein D3C87_1787410 [compost metagenome]